MQIIYRKAFESRLDYTLNNLIMLLTLVSRQPTANTGTSKLLIPSASQDRRRSSCKIAISPISVQTRLAASATTPSTKSSPNHNTESSCLIDQNSPCGSDVFLPLIDQTENSSSGPGHLMTLNSPTPLINIPSIHICDESSS